MKEYTYIIFDFFGTLVEYSPSLFDSPCPNTVQLLRRQGFNFKENEFIQVLHDCFATLEQEAAETTLEYSMDEVALKLYAAIGGETVANASLQALVSTYMAEWRQGVCLYEGVPALLRNTACKKAIITNTHYPSLVPDLVRLFDIENHFDLIETSVEHGYRKPSKRIFLDTVDKLGCRVDEILYVGDNPECDYFGPKRVHMDAVIIAHEQIADIPPEHQIGSIGELAAYLETAG